MTPPSMPEQFPGAPIGLHPCPQCGAWQWLQGLKYYRCAACGYKDGPTPQEKLGACPRNIL